MRTVLTKSPLEAAAKLKLGGIVAFPTETVYGLGGDLFDAGAIQSIFEAKLRPPDNPLIAHIGEIEHVNLIASEITSHAEKFIEAFFPGPLTILLQKAPRVPAIATAGLDTIGVRMPRHELAHIFLQSCGFPVGAPSANLSGRPSPTTWEAVYDDLNGRIDCILQGEMTEIGLESTVVDCTSDIPLVLRPGAISLEQLRSIAPETQIYRIAECEAARSPGQRHKHYAPNAKVVLVGSDFRALNAATSAFIGLQDPHLEFSRTKICRSVEEYAHSVFAFFRECDARNIKTIYCVEVEEAGIGAALMDRLRRAAE